MGNVAMESSFISGGEPTQESASPPLSCNAALPEPEILFGFLHFKEQAMPKRYGTEPVRSTSSLPDTADSPLAPSVDEKISDASGTITLTKLEAALVARITQKNLADN